MVYINRASKVRGSNVITEVWPIGTYRMSEIIYLPEAVIIGSKERDRAAILLHLTSPHNSNSKNTACSMMYFL